MSAPPISSVATARSDFEAAGLAPTTGEDGFTALCPSCSGLITVRSVDGLAIITCDNACSLSAIADRLRDRRAELGTWPVDGSAAPDAKARRVVLTPASAITPETVRWVERGRIPRNSLFVIAGEPKLGKSTYAGAYLSAHITRGTLDGDLSGTPADVLIASAEDSWGAVIVPRLMAVDADLDRVHRVEVHAAGGEDLLTLPDDTGALEEQLQVLRQQGRTVGLVVIDPIGSFLSGSIDSYRDASVRRALAPLAKIAERERTAIGVVCHLKKDEAQKLLSRINGSGAFGAAARSVLGFAHDPDDPDGERGNRRVIVHAASNWGRLAPTLVAAVEARSVDLPNGDRTDIGVLVVTGESNVGAEDLQFDVDERDEITDAMEWLQDELSDGAWHPSKPLKQSAAGSGIKPRTLQRAKKRLGIEDTREGQPRGQSAWRLRPDQLTLADTDDLAPRSRATDDGARSEATQSRTVEPNSDTHDSSRATPLVRREVATVDLRYLDGDEVEAFIAECIEQFGAVEEMS